MALAQSDVSVSLNGAPLILNPAPQERAGRVFVPLRGVFERLGASVVYENGTINAQGSGHSVSLRIGSTQAMVDGQNQMLDVAPFIIGDSTYVPLRFVSQALGATVNYDSSNRMVALTDGRGGQSNGQMQQRAQDQRAQAAQQQQQRQLALEQQQAQQRAQAEQQQQQQRSLDQQQQAQRVQAEQQQQRAQQHRQRVAQQQQSQPSPLSFAVVHPGRGETVASRRPTVEADFGNAQADPNSIRVSIDGLDITGQSSRSPRGVVFSPSDLQSGRHEVRVSGNDLNGMPFNGTWTFSSGTAVVSNTITNLLPGNGSAVRGQFMVSGHTMAGARVTVQVGTVAEHSAQDVIGQLLGVGNGSSSVRSEVVADGNGNFHAPMEIQARSGQQMTLVVDSTDARSQSAAPRVVRNLTAE